MSPRKPVARTKLLDASVELILGQGIEATRVDEVCARAGVTKGAFFHHFPSKEALAVAAAEHWGALTGRVFAEAGYHDIEDPVERLMAYLDLRASLVAGATPAGYSCVAGTMAQEVFESAPAVRDACGAMILDHVATLVPDFEAALAAYPSSDTEVTAHGLAVHSQVVLHGAFVVSKAADDPQIVLDAIEHLRRYLRCLFSDEGATP